MSITIDLPPAIEKEAHDYVTVQGTTFERMFLDYLRKELKRRRELDATMSEFDALVEATSSRRDSPYSFNRADAYGVCHISAGVERVFKHCAFEAKDGHL